MVLSSIKLQSPDYDRKTTRGAMTAASAVLVVETAGFFTAGDVGRNIEVVGADATGDDGTLKTTIAGFTNGTTVTLTAPAGVTVSQAFVRLGAGGFEIELPCSQDLLDGISNATILTLFDGKNSIFDFRQYSETLVLSGVITQEVAKACGFDNAVNMRDEIRRIRQAVAGPYGLYTAGAAKSWQMENGSGASSGAWNSATLASDEQDPAAPSRGAGKCRLVYDDFWDRSTNTYKRLFLYGTVSKATCGPRPGATTKTRIPYVVTFVVGDVKLGT